MTGYKVPRPMIIEKIEKIVCRTFNVGRLRNMLYEISVFIMIKLTGIV